MVPLIEIEYRPSGPVTSVDVPVEQLAWHAMYTGGPLPGDPWQHLMYRQGCLATVLACLTIVDGEWRASDLYHGLETSEKIQASYRLGTALAGVAGELLFGHQALVHREAILGKSAGPRGDLVGVNAVAGTWHGIEAKGKSPSLASGSYQAVSDSAYDAAKAQAESLAEDLAAVGVVPGSDHWAVTALTSTVAPVRLVLEDPEGGPPGPPKGPAPDAEFTDADPNERMLQAFYQAAGDISLHEAPSRQAAPADVLDFLLDYRWAQLLPSGVWVGVSQQVLTARADHRLYVERDLLLGRRNAGGVPGGRWSAGLAVTF